ncbi:MAG: hypothetical protein FWE95_06800 [Planctomycetaceae bacterium]|nr:hypothetical protein [Planctomycetaceae bacterium]
MLEKELAALIEVKIEEAVLRYETKVLPVLYELDRMHARIAYNMMRQRVADDITEQFNNAWDELKRLIFDIERRESKDDQKTDQQ